MYVAWGAGIRRYIYSIIHRIAAHGWVQPGISLRWFFHRRAQFQAILESSESELTTSCYVRLIILSITQLFYTALYTAFVFITHVKCGIKPWASWYAMHTGWNTIKQVPKAIAPPIYWHYYLAAWCIVPLSSVLFFALFGFGQGAQSDYLRFFRWIFRIKPKTDSILPIR